MTDQQRYGKFTKSQVEAFLDQPLLGRLATCMPSKENPTLFQPHNVPVWYVWDGESLYISAFQSTRKTREARHNPYIAVLIDVKEPVCGITAVLMEGKSELIVASPLVQEMSRVIYTKYMGEEGVLAPDPQSWIVDPDNAIIRLSPGRVYTW